LGEGFTDLVGQTSAALDLKDREAVFAFFAKTKPRYVVLAVAKVGGILANSTFPVESLSDNLRIQVNMLDAALEHGVERLLFLGSSCIYPKLAAQPITEDALLAGYLEPTNDAYAIAKIAGILQIQAVRRQHGLDLGDADESVWPRRQLFASGFARAAGADSSLRRGGGVGRCVGDQLEHRNAAA
jgi:GDP-L-fucose synthase